MTPQGSTGSDVPFLGLHYFDERHESLFFGRDEQLRDLLAKLTGARLVTVIGSSGTGKSSLVRAAGFPALRAGFLTDLRPRWRLVTMFPGSSPIRNLASALETEFSTTDVELTLRRGRLGLLEAAQQCGLRDTENLLVFVDQFEEIFRYQRVAPDRAAATDEASAFVQMLLEASADPGSAIYVIVTMRSDYLGACAQFRNLPERINTGLYLIPRMRRDHLEDAIAGPAAVMGAAFAPPLVQRMLNDVGEDPDQLPVLQHALLRTWLNWTGDRTRPKEIDFSHYTTTGGVRDSINNHAEEIYKAFGERDRAIAETIFKALTERDPANLDIRRPTAAGVIAAIAGVSVADVARVARPFRSERVAFLRPTVPNESPGEHATDDLSAETQLDITHESLIRKWYRLGGVPAGEKAASTAAGARADVRGWVAEEAEVRDVYRDLVKRARGGTSLVGADLDAAIAWRERQLPREWALRYDRDSETYDKVLGCIEESERARDKRRLRQKLTIAGGLLSLALIVVAGLAALEGRRDAQNEGDLRRQAESFRENATARQLSTQAEALRDEDSRPELSALLGIEALSRTTIPEASQALRWALTLLHKQRWSTQPPSPPPGAADEDAVIDDASLRFSGSGKYLALLVVNKAVRVHRASDGLEIPLPPIQGNPSWISWSGDELRVLVDARDASHVAYAVMTITPGAPGSRELLNVPCKAKLSCDSELTRDGTRLLVLDGSVVTAYPLDGGAAQTLGEDVVTADGEWVLSLAKARERNEPQRFRLARNGKPAEGEIEGSDDPDPHIDLGATSGVLAVPGRGGQIRIYAKEPALTLAGQVSLRGSQAAFALSPDGQQLAVGRSDGEVRVIAWATQRPSAGWSHAAPVVSVAFSPDGKSVASLDDAGTLRVVPLDSPGEGAISDWVPLVPNERRTLTWSFDPRGRYALSRSPQLGHSDVFDTRTGESVLKGEQADFVALSPDGAFVASAYRDGRLSVLNVETKTSTNVDLPLPGGHPMALSISPGGKYLAIRTRGDSGLLLVVIDVSGRTIVRLPDSVTGSTGPIFSGDGRWLAVYQTGSSTKPATAMLVDCRSWELAGTWEFSSQALSLTFSPDGGSLLVRGTGRRIGDVTRPAYRFVDTASKKERPSYLTDGATLLFARYSPDGTRVAIGTREGQHAALRIFETASGKMVANLLLDSAPTGAAISARNRLVATTSNAGVQVFALPDGKEISRASVHEADRASQPRFSDDEQSIEFLSTWTNPSDDSSAHDYGIRRLALDPAVLIRGACGRVVRPLSPEEWKKYLPDDTYRDTCKELPASKGR